MRLQYARLKVERGWVSDMSSYFGLMHMPIELIYGKNRISTRWGTFIFTILIYEDRNRFLHRPSLPLINTLLLLLDRQQAQFNLRHPSNLLLQV
jgi:hypothetical protein